MNGCGSLFVMLWHAFIVWGIVVAGILATVLVVAIPRVRRMYAEMPQGPGMGDGGAD